MLAALQPIFRFILTFSAIVGMAFMVICTAFIIISFIRGDIKIGTVREENGKRG